MERKPGNMHNMESKLNEAQKKEEEKKTSVKRILLYILLVFAVAYSLEFFIVMPLVGSTDADQAMAAQSILSSVMFVPAFGAILIRWLTKEQLTITNLMINLRLKENLKYYGLAWFGAAALILFGTVLYFLLSPGKFDPGFGYVRMILTEQAKETGTEVTDQIIQRAILLQFVMGVVMSPFADLLGGLGVEWGFRGYLLPKMLKHFKAVPAVLLTGVIFGLWNAPLVVMGQNYGLGYPGYPVTGILLMCLYCTTTGVLLSYVTIKTKSIIPAVMARGVLNGFNSIGVLFSSMDNPYNLLLGPVSTGLIGGIGFLLVAVFLLYQLYQEEKTSPIEL